MANKQDFAKGGDESSLDQSHSSLLQSQMDMSTLEKDNFMDHSMVQSLQDSLDVS